MGLKARILRVVQPENGGPRARTVLSGLARDDKQRAAFPRIFRELIERRELVRYRGRRGATYGPPKRNKLVRFVREGKEGLIEQSNGRRGATDGPPEMKGRAS